MPYSWIIKPVAVASAVAFSTLGLLSTRYQKARYYFHSTIFLTTLGAASVWGLLLSVVAAATGDRLNINHYVARSFYHMCHPLVGMDFDIEGQEHLDKLLANSDNDHQSAVLIGNHQSMVDLLYLGAIFPKRTTIMAKKELKWAPLLGQFMTLSGTVFINRGNRKDAVRTVTQAGEDMKRRGLSLWIFPEGTRKSWAEPNLLPFKKGAFHLAIQAQVPVVVVVCENYNRLFDGRTRFDSGRVKIKILPPIPTTGMTIDDVSSLSDHARELMLTTLREISRPPIASITAEPEPTSPDASDAEPKAEAASVPGSIVTSTESLVSKGQATEDEMDEDAVVLKHPN